MDEFVGKGEQAEASKVVTISRRIVVEGGTDSAVVVEHVTPSKRKPSRLNSSIQ